MDYPSRPKTPPRQFALMPKNIFTRLWFWYLSRYMNTDRYRLTKRGRTPGRNTPRGLRQDVSMKWGTRIGLYIDDKHEGKLRQYWLEQGRCDERIRVAGREREEREEQKAKAVTSDQRKAVTAIFIGKHRQN